MKCWIIAATACLLARGTWAAVNFGAVAEEVVLPENQATATKAFKVQATTDTTGVSAADAVTFSIHSVDGVTGSDKFTIAGTGNDEIHCKASPGFDYETKKTHEVVVQGLDDGTVPESATASYTVVLSDIDDHESTEQQTCGSASADALSGDVVANVAVCDADVNSAITYAKAASGHTDGPAFDVSSAGIVTKSANAFADSTLTSYLVVYEAQGVVNTATFTLTVTIGGTCPCLSANGSSSLNLGLFTLLAAFLLLKI